MRRNSDGKMKIRWFASAPEAGILRKGPFPSQHDAWSSMLLTDKEADRQQRIHAKGCYVWCERIEVAP